MAKYRLVVCAILLCLGAAAQTPFAPGCANETARQCLALALDAMGGLDHLQQVKTVRLEIIGNTLLAEQSYRQAPFISSYERGHITLDLANQRSLKEVKMTWPESDPGKADSDMTVVTGPEGGVVRGKSDRPCSRGDLDSAREMLALGPARLLLTASAASDLRYADPETVRSTSHAVLVFSWRNMPVRVLLNQFNHLPDAVETTQSFHDFWYFWGDVHQRVYFDNYQFNHGISYPTNIIEERNGILWRSTQAISVEFNVPVDEKAFVMDEKASTQSAASTGWNRPFRLGEAVSLASGVDLLLGSWNATIVRQADGLVILEAPISEPYAKGVMDEARKRYPGLPVKAVLSTSDSWPHTGGLRYAVSQGLPIYILDLNQPLLDKMMAAPHTLDPDTLQKTKTAGAPKWKIVGDRVPIGIGTNRMDLYPLRGASTERQYMVYFPESRLLYASDTLVLNDDGSIYDPQLVTEVAQAVKRAGIRVETVYAMHQAPVAWDKVMAQLDKYR